MTGDDRGRFARALAVLGETFNEPISEIRTEAYWRALEDVSIDAYEAACMEALRTKTFFPKPAELRELLDGSLEDQAELAWSDLCSEVRRVGSWGTPTLEVATINAMRALFGSWLRCCELLPAGGPELLGWRKQFLSLYSVTSRRERIALAESAPLRLLEEPKR